MLQSEVYTQALAAYQADPSISQAKVAERYGISQTTMRNLVKQSGVGVNRVSYPGCHDDKRDTIVDHWQRGMSLAQIQRIFGVSKEVVRRWLAEADELKPQPVPAEPIVLTVLEPIQPWEDSGEIIHMGNLGRVIHEQYGQAWEGDE